MSYRVFFAFSTGLAAPLKAPAKTLASLISHVEWVESEMGFVATQYAENPPNWHWSMMREAIEKVDDKTLCRVASDHNEWVRDAYADFAKWAESPVENGEIITPDDAKKFWHGLSEIQVPFARWTADYYQDRMKHLFEVLRGRESEGVSFDAKALTMAQADAVIQLFDNVLPFNLELQVAGNSDCLSKGDDCIWCEKCGSHDRDDLGSLLDNCRKRKCPIRRDYGDEDSDV